MDVRHQLRTPALYARAFTLIELLIAMTIGLVVVGSIFTVYVAQQRSYRSLQLNLENNQNLRGALIIFEQEVRMAGYDPLESGLFGIVDVRRYHLVNNRELDPNGQPALFYTLDMDENGALDDRNGYRNREHPNFRIRHDLNIDRHYLAWDMGGGRQPLAENIQAIGLAYAVDIDRDGLADCWKGGSHMIWAVDTDNDNLLDTHLDSNDDGYINEGDDANGDGKIDGNDGGLLDQPVGVDRIKAVRVWLLAVSSQPSAGRQNSGKLIVGDRIIETINDGYIYKVFETRIHCRNL